MQKNKVQKLEDALVEQMLFAAGFIGYQGYHGSHDMAVCATSVIRAAESQKPGMRVCIANRKVFARPESFCAYLRNWPYNEP